MTNNDLSFLQWVSASGTYAHRVVTPSGTSVLLSYNASGLPSASAADARAALTNCLAGAVLNYFAMTEQASAPSASAADQAVLYCEDNGGGKTRLVIKFNTGAAIVLATQV